MTIGGLEARLRREQFVRVHKSHLVSVSPISALEGNELVINGTKIPISRNLKDNVMRRTLWR